MTSLCFLNKEKKQSSEEKSEILGKILFVKSELHFVTTDFLQGILYIIVTRFLTCS